jgi:hypothetical protein
MTRALAALDRDPARVFIGGYAFDGLPAAASAFWAIRLRHESKDRR